MDENPDIAKGVGSATGFAGDTTFDASDDISLLAYLDFEDVLVNQYTVVYLRGELLMI